VKCSEVYPDDTSAILEGCACGAKAFFYRRDTILATDIERPGSDDASVLSSTLQRIGDRVVSGDMHGNTVIIDLDMVRSEVDGQYDVDVEALLHRKDTIYTPEEGRYAINCDQLLRRRKQ
jgi:predicted  nucleic acid-binding Zn-ribbon protein